MEALTRLVTDSLARHGLDRPVDPRRLQWSRWFRCESPHSLLVVPSKPGIFAIAEDALAENIPGRLTNREGHGFGLKPALSERGGPKDAGSETLKSATSAAEVIPRRMLAVLQFSEDDNMAYVLDRMFTCINPMRTRLHSGNCFVRFVVVDDQQQRRTICAALNQWMRNSAEKASGFSADFSSSLEWTNVDATDRVGGTLPSTSSESARSLPKGQASSTKADAIETLPPAIPLAPKPTFGNASSQGPQEAGAIKNLHCPHPLPSGF